MDKAKYFRIISAPSFLDKFIEKEFRLAGYLPASGAEENEDAVAIFVASSSEPPPPADDVNLVVVRPEGALRSCGNENPSATTILTPYIIGTGMEGIMRDIVAMTARGTMIKVKDNQAKVSVIHASDVARLVLLLAGSPGIYIVSDGIDPTWNELTEALSVRVGHPRIPTISSRMASWYALTGRLLGGPNRKMLSTLSTDATVTATPLPIEFNAISTIEYLKNHEYTDEDL